MTAAWAISGTFLAFGLGVGVARGSLTDLGEVAILVAAATNTALTFLVAIGAIRTPPPPAKSPLVQFLHKQVPKERVASLATQSIMFIAKTVTVDVVWVRGGKETPVGQLSYPMQDHADFMAIDSVLEPFAVPEPPAEPTPAEPPAEPAQAGRQQPAQQLPTRHRMSTPRPGGGASPPLSEQHSR